MTVFVTILLLLHTCNFIYIQGLTSTSSNRSGGLKSIQVQVPAYRLPGDSAILQCDYDLDNDSLYSVKWYKEHEEFYRFVPRAKPQANSYPVKGVKVDMSRSNSKKVVLYPVTSESNGFYRCEVSAEAPSFASGQSEGRLEIVVLPTEDPTITGVETQYQIGDEISLNCTSGKSYPSSVLFWYINEQKVMSPNSLKHYPPIFDNGLYSTTLGLQFKLNQRHFLGSSMKIRCVSSISPALQRGERQREGIIHSLPLQEMREALLLVESSSTKYSASFVILFALWKILLVM